MLCFADPWAAGDASRARDRGQRPKTIPHSAQMSVRLPEDPMCEAKMSGRLASTLYHCGGRNPPVLHEVGGPRSCVDVSLLCCDACRTSCMLQGAVRTWQEAASCFRAGPRRGPFLSTILLGKLNARCPVQLFSLYRRGPAIPRL